MSINIFSTAFRVSDGMWLEHTSVVHCLDKAVIRAFSGKLLLHYHPNSHFTLIYDKLK